MKEEIMNKKTAVFFSIAFAFVLVLSATASIQAEEIIKCPVSGETFNKSDDSESYVYKGKTYYFCCPGCKESFVKDPEKYLKAVEEGKEAPGHEHGETACACSSEEQASEAHAHTTEAHEHTAHAHTAEGQEHAEHAEQATDTGAVKCAVMGHEIKDVTKAPKSEYNGKTYYFCCEGCKEKFDKEPEKYAKKDEKVICPVMGNEVKDLEKAPKYEYEGKTYYFCCPGCIDQFKADPEKYINKK
jgi:Cu+-exporting ATPase